jgi:formylglycine-generating enzyme required for sulfatase activity
MKLLIRFLLATFVLAVLPTTDVLAQANRITGPTGSTSKPPKKKPPKKKPTQPTTPSVNTSPRADEVITVRGVSFKMIVVQGGTFQMGSNDSDASDDEKPVHQVTLNTFSIGETEVTQELWQAVMGNNPSKFKGPKRPVEQVSWERCQKFIQRLNSLTGRNFRLPTEAEWEYAAHGGKRSNGYKYSGSSDIANVAWYYDNSGSQTHDVGTKRANELGLYDMTGNVWEWCQDWYGKYSSSAQTNPKGPSSGSYRVIRGCSGNLNASYCRVSDRSSNPPSANYSFNGLRLAE